MARALLTWAGVWLVVSSGLLQAATQKLGATPAPPAAQYRALLDKYCVVCHNEKLRTANLLLDQADVEKVPEGAAIWEKVIQKLRTRAMPPKGVPRPDDAAYNSFASYLETTIDREAATNPNPGKAVTRRLNRNEYANAVRDLLALNIDGASYLPADENSFGFDNIGDTLTVSPMLIERYLSAARKISRLAIGDTGSQPLTDTYTVPRYLMQQDRVGEDLPFGLRGGIAVRHYFPADGQYDIQVRLWKDSRDYIRGLAEPHRLDVLLGNAKIGQFTIGGEKLGRSTPSFSNANFGDDAQEKYERTADDILHLRISVKAGTQLVGAAFVKETVVPENWRDGEEVPALAESTSERQTSAEDGTLQPPLGRIEYAQWKGGDPAVGSLTISGPYSATGVGETASRRKILLCRPANRKEEGPCAKRILSALATAAYRRPVTDAETASLMGFYKNGYDATSNGRPFEMGIEAGLERILVDPNFLFIIQRAPANVPPGTVYHITNVELASRLSFFLWSSMPDSELLDLAVKGKLQQPAVLEQQVQRMLADPRSHAFVVNFAGQWLMLRNLASINPDPDVFPYWDDNLRISLRQQSELFFESIIREDRAVTDLLDADYTFVNERLARFYGISDILGNQFRRVIVTDENRRGLLGQGAILAVTAYPNRTSPVLRGKWILENVLGSPPPPPPPNVPALKEEADDGKQLTVRQRMEAHRANAVCATCHARMDPLGFALENFDAIGGWRTMDANLPIDASGQLPDGTKFQGPAELRKLLVNHRDEFVSTLTEKLLTYALGRGTDYYDQPAIRGILREAAPKSYRWSSLVVGIVESTPFQMGSSREQ